MAGNKKYVEISKFMSLVLRHKPEEAGITLSKNGWAEIDQLLWGIKQKWNWVEKEDILKIVAEDEKGRYIISTDGLKIKAAQGHSIQVNLELEPVEPPKYLYHGTALRFWNDILKVGEIKPMSRQYVHLSPDLKTASEVGRRHGEVLILVVAAHDMWEKGYKFYQAENGVWLTDIVPVRFTAKANEKGPWNQEV